MVPEQQLLEIRDLVVRYDAHTVLNRVSLSLARAERVAVLGPSGSGKTTLFRAINGFARVASGSIRLNGVEVTSAGGRPLRQLRSRIAVVSQRHDLVDRLGVCQNVMAGALGKWPWWRALRFLAHPSQEELRDAEQALRRVGLAHKLRAPTANLSGGERQRVAIARALVQQPILLLADEPIASLDPALSEQILSLLCSLAEEHNVALLCSLHQPDLATKFFPRILRVQAGQLHDSSAPAPSPIPVGA